MEEIVADAQEETDGEDIYRTKVENQQNPGNAPEGKAVPGKFRLYPLP